MHGQETRELVLKLIHVRDRAGSSSIRLDTHKRDEDPSPSEFSEENGYMIFGILIELGDNPSWSIRDAKIQDLSLLDEIVKRVSQFLNRCCVIPFVWLEFVMFIAMVEYIPPVHIQDVDIICL